MFGLMDAFALPPPQRAASTAAPASPMSNILYPLSFSGTSAARGFLEGLRKRLADQVIVYGPPIFERDTPVTLYVTSTILAIAREAHLEPPPIGMPIGPGELPGDVATILFR